jgi:hypothetical protein
MTPISGSPRRKKALGVLGIGKMKLQRLEEKMTKLLMATAAMLALNTAAASANGYPADPRAAGINSADQTYVSNGGFVWRHKRHYRQIPWYAYSASGNCFVWTPNAYHYACDPNARY